MARYKSRLSLDCPYIVGMAVFVRASAEDYEMAAWQSERRITLCNQTAHGHRSSRPAGAECDNTLEPLAF